MSMSLYNRLARRYAPERFTLSRRDLLKATLAASAGLLLSNCEAGDSGEIHPPRSINKKIIVIGAGFAGLAAAYELASVGYDVTVIEGQSRVGGRVISFTDIAPGRIIEGGGELVGSNHPTWVAYAGKFRLEFREIPDEPDLNQPMVFQGKKLTDDEAKKLLADMDKAYATLNDACQVVDENQPWRTDGADAMDASNMGKWLDSLNVADLTKRAIRAETEANESVPLERQSYLAYLTMVKGGGGEKFWTDSETCRCAEGNQALASRFYALLGTNRVRLGDPVAAIAYGATGATVTTKSGLRFTADDVILTLAPSVWKNIRFTPELPGDLHPQMGVAVKYLSGVKRRFWKDSKLAPDAMTDGDVSMTWEGTAGIESDDNAEITCFSGGPAAEHLQGRDPVQVHALFQGQLTQLYPEYAKNVETTKYMNWPTHPFVMASYSFPAPGQITKIGPTLYQGLNHLHFAGEYTCYKFVGYMEGGLNSGVAIARRLATRDQVV